jgi:hypothetical protein
MSKSEFTCCLFDAGRGDSFLNRNERGTSSKHWYNGWYGAGLFRGHRTWHLRYASQLKTICHTRR